MSGGAAVVEAVGAIAALELPGARRGRGRRDREHAVRPRGQARRHRARQVRRDDRGQQHRRRGPDRAGRLPRARDRPRRRAARRPRDADRRDRRRARHALRGPVRQRRRLGERDPRAGERTGELVWRMPLHARLREDDRGPLRRHRQLAPPTAAAARSPPPSSCTASPATCRGRTSTSRARAYDDGKPYAPKGGAGWGVRLLVELRAGEPAAPDLH